MGELKTNKGGANGGDSGNTVLKEGSNPSPSTINVKEIRVVPIDSKSANAFVRKHHYSGKVVPNSSLHFGCMYEGKLHGVLSYGPSMDKSKVQGLVKGTGWNEFVELNRMAFDDFLPKNSESRCIAVSIRLIKKNCPHIKWIISYSDASQCGDGTIYRAVGFALTSIKENKATIRMPGGETISTLTITAHPETLKELAAKYNVKFKGGASVKPFIQAGGQFILGYQLRYIYFIDRFAKDNCTVPILEYSEIDKMNAGMYMGKSISLAERKANMRG